MSLHIVCDCYLICRDIGMCQILVKLPNMNCVEVCTAVLELLPCGQLWQS